MNRIQMILGGEYDALTRAKRFHSWRAGMRDEIKRAYRRRERHVGKLEMMAELSSVQPQHHSQSRTDPSHGETEEDQAVHRT